ncbi:MAG TPA: leucyl aminopeptidase [Dermatophilaceae bacterium]|nr:leucyl aminopeptidase [Dermatophilaceae bacterium]
MPALADVADVAPSLTSLAEVRVVASGAALGDVDAVAVPVTAGGEVPEVLGVDREALRRAGFSGEVGSALAFPRLEAPVPVAVGVGELADLTVAAVRDAAAAFACAVPRDTRLAAHVPQLAGVDLAEAAAAVVEGVLLARYRFSLRSTPADVGPVESVVLVAPEGHEDAVDAGARRGHALARAGILSRDLATCPAGMLTATRMADVAAAVASQAGLEVEVFDKEDLVRMSCGGLLGVNRGSVEPPRMIRLRYTPEDASGHLALVGKGIMYDSGGINLKPSDVSHSQMKNDMTGAGAILGTMSVLKELGCSARVTAYLMCTDNMPSGSAMQLGDVLTMRNGKTVEVLNTDAEGRLVMADALVLSVEDGADAIVDLATLTGACLRTFGTEVAGVMGNDDGVIDQVRRAGELADEPVWQLPIIRRYRSQLDSGVADFTNMGGPNAGSITAALFLEEFVAGRPWAHVDIAGTGQVEATTRWIPKGPTGFGARLLAELAVAFRPPGTDRQGNRRGNGADPTPGAPPPRPVSPRPPRG